MSGIIICAFFSATWQLGRIQVDIPNLGKIQACNKNHIAITPININASIRPPFFSGPVSVFIITT